MPIRHHFPVRLARDLRINLSRSAIGLPLLVSAALAVMPGPGWSAEAKRLVLVERSTASGVAHHGAKGDNVGDVMTFGDDIYDEANTQQLGHDQGWCIRTVVGKSWQCFWTVSLGDGEIHIFGPYNDDSDSILQITAGTGAYAHAKGSMALHSRDPEGSAYDLVFSFAD